VGNFNVEYIYDMFECGEENYVLGLRYESACCMFRGLRR
jgi:hypothetical protein